MSHFEDIPVQPDHVAGWAIHYIIVGIVAAIALCVGVVWLFLGEDLSGGGRSAVVDVRSVPPASSFAGETALEAIRHAQLLQLDHWQWADSTHTQVIVPVDVAIDRYLEDHR